MDWIPSWIWWIIGFLIVREIAAVFFGWKGETFGIGTDTDGGTFGKSLNWHKRKRQHTTIGWRPDPINKEDGFTDNGDGSYSRQIK